MEKYSKEKLIISISNNDINFCLSAYNQNDLIITPYNPIYNVYKKLNVNSKQIKYIFLFFICSKYKTVYIFGQGPSFLILYFRKLFKLFVINN